MRKKLSIFTVFVAGSLLLGACGNPNTQQSVAPTNDTVNENQEDTDQTETGDQPEETEQDTDQDDTNQSESPGTTLTPPPGLSEATDANIQRLVTEREDATGMIHDEFPQVELVLNVMKFRNSFSDTEGLATNYYIFKQPSGEDQRFYYVADMPRDGTASRIFLLLQNSFDFGQTLIPIPLESWQTSYIDAISSADELGGDQFRSRHDNWEVTAILGKPAGESQPLSWSVSYRALDGSGAEFIVSVNASTGEAEVVEEPPVSQENLR